MGLVQFARPGNTPMKHSLMHASGPLASRTAPPPAVVLREGQRFAGRFTVQGLLDHGGMGSLYLADDNVTGEQVCLKLIRPEFTDTPQAVAQFMEEGKLARRLSHWNIGRVFDIDRKDGVCFITMEHAKGMNLRRWLNRRLEQDRPVRVADVMWVARRLLAALEYTHGRGVIHRDIKPENIVIAAGDDDTQKDLKLVDFGLACRVRPDAAWRQASERVGTWGYMAPEVYHGGEADARSDLYGVAVVLFEMLTGQMYLGDWTPLMHRRGSMSPDFEMVLRQALSPLAGQRPQSAAEMLLRLEAASRLAPAVAVREVRMVPLARTVLGVGVHVLVSGVLVLALFVAMNARAERKVQRVEKELMVTEAAHARAVMEQRELAQRVDELEDKLRARSDGRGKPAPGPKG